MGTAAPGLLLWQTAVDLIPEVAGRSRARDMIESWRLTLSALDAPEGNQYRIAYGHAARLEVVTHARGMVAVSGYTNPLYDWALSG
jgi:hypothetical protein